MRRCSTEFRLTMKVTADNLKSAILSRIREVCERKAEAYIEPVHALVIRDDLYLSVCCACTFDEFRALVDQLAGEGLITVHRTATDTALRPNIEDSEL